MILERLVFLNFRQFKGRQELVFSDSPERNVTVVHAENGFGKTTILKGLLWVLYGRDGLMGTDGEPDDFEKPDRIINESVAARSSVLTGTEAAVELTFKHDKDRYILRRSLSLAQQNLDPRKTDLSLSVMRDGQTFRQDNPQQRIQSIVPDGVRKLLFFNGERINYLAMERSSAEVAAAIRQMLGLQLLETTINDLNHPNVKGKLRADLRTQPTSEEKRDLLDQQDCATETLKEHEEFIQQIRRNLSSLEDEIASIDGKLLVDKRAHELQAKRVRLSKELDELRARKDETTKKLAKLISEDGYMLFTTDLVRRGQEIMTRLRSEGKIPARVLNSFLSDLLASETCICSRGLALGSPERAAVEGLMEIAGDAEFNNAVGALDHAIGVLEEGARKTEERIRELNRDRLELARQISEREEQIEALHQEIGSGKNNDEAKELESRRTRLGLERDSQNAEMGRRQGRIEAVRKELARLDDQMRHIEEKNASAELAQRRLDAVTDCAKILQEILDAETADLRPLLNEEISRHFRRIMDRDFWPELAEDFTLRIRKRVAGAVTEGQENEIDAALSTGQRTVTSLVFIASLVALASRRSKIPTIIRGLSGSDYPIAIDSPFGSLSMFRKDVARYIPDLAPQVLLLVSPSQYDGAVHEALESSGRVGKRYYLSFTGPTIRENASDKLEIGDRRIQQYFPSEDDEFTRILEL